MVDEEHDYLAAEQRARKEIDRKLREAGWVVQDKDRANLYAGQGVALREFSHRKGHGRSDYGLYIDRQLVGVLEAKADGTTLTEVERQTRKYIEGVPDAIPAALTPLPFGYEATGWTRTTTRGTTPRIGSTWSGSAGAATCGPSERQPGSVQSRLNWSWS